MIDLDALMARCRARERAWTPRPTSTRGYVGPREDAEPADALPTLVWGRDTKPTVCPRDVCRSRFLEHDAPGGRDKLGSSTCCTCSRQICWWKG